ncbi:MAG: hypothetical protein AAF960_08725 [Bacteroidota bacterium]
MNNQSITGRNTIDYCGGGRLTGMAMPSLWGVPTSPKRGVFIFLSN